MADLSRINANWLATFDRDIQEFRSLYDECSSDEKAAFRNWLSRFCSIIDEQPDSVSVTVQFRVNNLVVGDEGVVTYDGVVHLGPKSMLSAIEAWDSGGEFTPESFVQID